LNEKGEQVMVPPDLTLAVVAASKVAPYVHSQLRPKEEEAEYPERNKLQEAKERVLAAFENMGVKVKREG
jgi:hypothetical protein